jgi:hypothetical protein
MQRTHVSSPLGEEEPHSPSTHVAGNRRAVDRMARNTIAPRVKAGSQAVGATKARRAIRRNAAAIRKTSERALRERQQARAASRKDLQVAQSALERLIERDAEARAALARLRRQTVEPRARLSSAKLARPSDEQLLSLHLNKRVSVIGPPYDFAWNWGNHTQQISNPATGQITIVAQSARTGAAAAGIGIVLTTDRPAMVSVRPYIHYEWEAHVVTAGLFSSAEVRGGIDASAWLDGALLTPVHRHQAFHEDSSSDRHRVGWGSAPVSEVGLRFAMEPGKVYAVPFGAWMECDDSPGLGAAGSAGAVDGVVQFVVVEQFVA